MNPHPSDQRVASLIRHARLGAATAQYPTRTRTVGQHAARQHSVGSLVVEAARADSGVAQEVAQARRETIAAELERRRMVEAAEEARRHAESDRLEAERAREDALSRARRQGGPDPDFFTLALIAAVSHEIAGDELAHVIDAAVSDDPALTPEAAAELEGEPRTGLSAEQLNAELAEAGASPGATESMPDTGVTGVAPAVFVGQSVESSTPAETPVAGPEPDESPEVG